MYEHQAYTQAMQEDKIVNDVAKVRMLQPVSGQHDHKGPVTVSIDIGRRVAKPINVIVH
ncbi:hypothetical protein GCM10009425_19040 [Pseudomonas asuensis]|uniref:Uncharacterized protein n=1 Tax=Pseudomonas asuensis TaxID=1825787 RepID=A0ABQ2GQD0_9PSED|nr:hypothetical protein GCM10009425_19040 [Pseudomonas asuensis]